MGTTNGWSCLIARNALVYKFFDEDEVPMIPENTVYEKKLLKYFSMCDGEGKLRIIQLAMNEFDRTQKEKKENQEPAVVG